MARGGSRKRAAVASPSTSDYRTRNRRIWERTSDAYDRRHRAALEQSAGRAWGLWRIPESRLRLLDPVRGRRVLELGCGAARWSRGLAALGARPVGIDLAQAQLAKARRLVGARRPRVALARGSAESLPFRAGVFDLVLSDWGALTFADPERAIPEVARVLAPGGQLVFAASSPFRFVAFDRARDREGRRLRRPYFARGTIVFDGLTEFTRTYGEWVALFRRHALAVERLVETTPPTGLRSSYLDARDEAWARRWPVECLWSLRREASTASGARTARRSARTSSR